MTEANFGKLAIPAKGEIRSTLDIQKASTVSVNKYMCTHIHVYVCICIYIYTHTYIHVHIHIHIHMYIYYMGWEVRKNVGGLNYMAKWTVGIKKVH